MRRRSWPPYYPPSAATATPQPCWRNRPQHSRLHVRPAANGVCTSLQNAFKVRLMSDEAKRADVFLVNQGLAASRAEAQAAIRAGNVTADGEQVRKAAQKLQSHMSVSYQPPHP